MAVLTARRQYHNPLETMQSLVSNKPLYSEHDWKVAADSEALYQYADALSKSDGIDISKLYSDYGLYFGDPTARMNALITETSSDRTNKVLRQIQKFDENGNAIFTKDEKGNDVPVYDSVEMSDYDFNKYLIRQQNKQYALTQLQERAKLLMERSDHFGRYLGDVLGIPLNLIEGAYQGVSDFFALIGGIAGAIGYGVFDFGNDDYWNNIADQFVSGINYTITNDELRKEFTQKMFEFEYNTTHYLDDEGNYNTGGAIAAGTAESIGKMLPFILLSRGVGAGAGKLASAAGATAATTAKVASTAGSIASKLGFYSSVVFTEDINQQYEYFKSQGITPPSAQIMASSAIKAGLQYAVEFGLGKLFGTTGMDKMIYGTADDGVFNTVAGKTLGKRGISRLFGDALQEGSEEFVQETTDFLVNAFMHNFVNHEFEDVKWDWETVGLAFVMGAISSIGMSAVNIIGTRKVETGNVKTTKTGEIIEGKSQRLGKIASWQFGYDMNSFLEAYNEVRVEGSKIAGENLVGKNVDKAQAKYAAAYKRATSAMRIITDLYGEVGETKFNQANDLLKVITEQIKDGTFDEKSVEEVNAALELSEPVLKAMGLANSVMIKAKMQKNKMSDIEEVVKGDEEASDRELAKAIKDYSDVSGENYDYVIVTKDGRQSIITGNVLIIPKNLLLKPGDKRIVVEEVAEAKLVDELVQGVVAKKYYFKNEMQIITDLYRQWSGTKEFDEEEAIFNLIFDTRFFEAVMSINEKLTSTYLLRLNILVKSTLKEKGIANKVLNKKLKECRQRWIEAALHFYSNNLNSNADEFTKSLDPKDRESFEKRLTMIMQMYNMGADIIRSPENVNDTVWEFMARRINNMNVDDSVKTELLSNIRDNDAHVREKALITISDYYDGAFMSLYDGRHYLTKDSFVNETFNSWLETIGLYAYQILDTAYLTEDDISYVGENPTLEDIVKLRKMQFNEYNPNMNLEYTNGNIVIKSDKGDDGFQVAYDILLKNSQAVLAGEIFTIGEDKVSRRIATDLKTNNKYIRSLLKPSIISDYMTEWLSIDDIVNHPEYIIESITDVIRQEYGAVNKITVYRYIAKQIADDSKGKKSLVTLQDGTIMVGDMTAINDMYVEGVEIPDKGVILLSALLKTEHITGILANCKVIVSSQYKSPEYVDYADHVNSDGSSNRVFVNEIHLPPSEQAYMRFALGHEIQHALQVEMRMNQGITKKPLELFSPKIQTAIIKDILASSPELFADMPKSRQVHTDSKVKDRVNHYLYFGSGEMQAMGLGATSMMTFYPVRVSRKNGNTIITLKNGNVYSAKVEVNSKMASARIVDTAQTMLENTYKKHNVPQPNHETTAKMYNEAAKMINKFLGQNKVTSDEYQELMYYAFSFDGDLDKFKESNVIIVTVGDERYAIRDISQFTNLINSVSVPLTNDKAVITLSYAQVKNIKSFKPIPRSYYGKVEIAKSYLKGTKHAEVDMSKLPTVIPSQQLITDRPDYLTNSLTGEVLDTPFDFERVVPNIDEIRQNLIDEGFEINFDALPEDLFSLITSVASANDKLQNLLTQYLFEVWGLETESSLKDNIVNTITSTDTFNSIMCLKRGLSVDLDYQTLINLELPIIRYQTLDYSNVKDDEFISVNFMNFMTEWWFGTSIPEYMGSTNANEGYIIGGTIKLKDCLLCIPYAHGMEILINPHKINNLKGSTFAAGYYNIATDRGTVSGPTSWFMDNSSYTPDVRNDEWPMGAWASSRPLSLKNLYDRCMEDLVVALETYNIDKSDYEYLVKLAKVVFQTVEDINAKRKYNLQTVTSLTEGDNAEDVQASGSAETYDGASKVWYNTSYANYETIIHELIHIISAEYIFNAEKNYSNRVEPVYDEDWAGLGLVTIFNELLERHCVRDGKIINWSQRKFYGLRTAAEMVAELANPDFVKFLEEENLYTSTISQLAKMFDIPLSKVYSEDLKSAKSMVEKGLDILCKSAHEEVPKFYRMLTNDNQSLMTPDDLNTGNYNGLLFKDGKQYKAEPVEFKGILVLDSDNTEMQEAKNAMKKHVGVNTDEEFAKELRRLAVDDRIKFDKIMKYFNNVNGAYQHILLGDNFVVIDNEISDLSIDPNYYINLSKSDSIETAETNSKTIDVAEVIKISKTPKNFKSIDNAIIDNRENKHGKFNPNEYYGQLTRYDRHRKPLRVVGRDKIEEEITDSAVHLSGTKKNVEFVRREFLARIIYSENYGDSGTYQDVYVYYYNKPDDDSRRTVHEDEWKNTNLKYFKKNNKQLQINPSLRKFIIASTNTILDSVIMDKIYDGSLKYSDLRDYILQDSSKIDVTTFRLINDALFHNDFVDSPELLDDLANDSGISIAAIYALQDETIIDEFFNIEMNLDQLDTFINALFQNPKYTKSLNKYVLGLYGGVGTHNYSSGYKENEAFNANLFEKIAKIKIMQSYDGTPASLSKAILHAFRNTSKNSKALGKGYWASALNTNDNKAIRALEKRRGTIGRTLHETIGDKSNDSNIDAAGVIDELLALSEEIDVSTVDIDNIKSELFDVESPIGKLAFTAISKLALAKNESKIEVFNYFKNYKDTLMGLSDSKIYDWWNNFVNESPVNKLIEIYVLADQSDIVNLLENYNEDAKDIVSNLRPYNKIKYLRNRVKTLRKYLAEVDYPRFLKENGDIFDENIELKETAFGTEINGETVYKSESEFKALNERINQLQNNAKAGVYTKNNFDRYLKLQTKQENANLELLKSLTPKTVVKKVIKKDTVVKEKIVYQPIYYYDTDGKQQIDVRNDKKVPKILTDVLSTGLSKRNKTEVQNLSLENETHLVSTLQSIFDDNFVRLQEVGEEEVIEFLEFFVNHGIMSTDTEMSRIAIQMESLLASYFLARYKFSKDRGVPVYQLDDDLVESTRKRLTDLATFAGQLLHNERYIKTMLDPNESRAQAMLKDLGIELSETDKEEVIKKLNDVLHALQTNDADYKQAKKEFEQLLLKKYRGAKRSMWSKILVFERAMMLSNPGTWLRNLTSNWIVLGGNIASEKLGEKVSTLFFKMFPKNKSFMMDDAVSYTKMTKEGEVKIERKQYRLNKKPEASTLNFIHQTFIQSGFIKDTINGLSKYNLDRLDHYQGSDNVTDMIARSIAAEIRRTQIFSTDSDSKKAKFADTMIKLVFDKISDDKFVQKSTIKYLGKILEEDFYDAKKDNPKLTFNEFVNTPDAKNNVYGIANHILVAYTKAANLAAADYMRSSNVMTGLDRLVRERAGEGGYFIYKQVFPFLSSSWAWCTEAMRYTPVGLAKAIINLARLENTVAKMDKMHQQGQSIVHSEFARYTVVRNVGKGAIGTIAFFLGAMLGGLGWAGIDEEDKKYKLNVFGIKVALDDILASQGITMGIALASNIKDEADVADILASVLDQLFKDSVFEDCVNTYRHSSGIGDWALREAADIPSQFIPNLFKSISAIVNHRGVMYSDNFILSRLQKFMLQIIPIAPAELVFASTKTNVYTGENESWFSFDLFTTAASKFTPIDLSLPSVNENELEAMSLDIKKGLLKGEYTVDEEKITLNAKNKIELNSYYGKLNDKKLTALRTNKLKVKSKMENGSYEELYYRQMIDKQKSAAFDTIMSTNSTLAKIYILTSTGQCKYYASESEYNELKKLGIIKNVYRKTDKINGFVKIN